MLKNLITGVLSAFALKLLENYRRLSIHLLKIEAAKSYLHGVKLARLSAIGLMQMGLFIALIATGTLLLHAAFFILLPWSTEAKAFLGLLLGLVYITAGAAALCRMVDEQTWLRQSGAAEILSEITGKKPL